MKEEKKSMDSMNFTKSDFYKIKKKKLKKFTIKAQ